MSYNQYNKTTFSSEILKEIFDFYNVHTKKETAEKYNITCKILDRLLKENNIPHHSKINISKKEEMKICNLYANYTSTYIGNIFHIKAKRVDKIILLNGIKLHSKEENKKLAEQVRQTTMINKYGVTSPNKNKEISEKRKQTNLIKYGVICPANTKESKEKQAKKLDAILKKRRQTCLKKYGVYEYTHTEEYWKSRKKTCLEKYGAEEWTKSKFFYQSFPGKFWCDNISFDSFPELATYLYFISHNLKIERPKIIFKYLSVDGEHTYHPDFKINNKLIEIKGDHFFKNGILINPYSDNEIDQQIAKDKWECMKENNIEVWTKKQYFQYVEWFYSLGLNKENFRDKKSNSKKIKI